MGVFPLWSLLPSCSLRGSQPPELLVCSRGLYWEPSSNRSLSVVPGKRAFPCSRYYLQSHLRALPCCHCCWCFLNLRSYSSASSRLCLTPSLTPSVIPLGVCLTESLPIFPVLTRSKVPQKAWQNHGKIMALHDAMICYMI